MVPRAAIVCTSAAMLALGFAPDVRADDEADAGTWEDAGAAADSGAANVPVATKTAADAPAVIVAPPALGDSHALGVPFAEDGDDAKESGHADLDELSFVLGAASFLVTSAIGGTMYGRAASPAVRNAGSEILSYGFAAAPFVAHVPAGEYLRGFAFSGTPLAMAGATTVLLASDPTAIDEQGTPATRVPYAAFFTVGMVASVVGIVDAAFASKRRRLPAVALVPSVSRDGASLKLGGTF